MNALYAIRRDWFSNLRGDVLAGLVVALALIPEAIAFSLIAGLDPRVGLYASFCIAVTIAFTGGRPGMISAATGAMALLMVTLVREHGLEYLLAATILTGLLQILAGYLKLADLMRFVSRSVVTGFVNALAILIFLAQIPELIGVPTAVYPMVVLGLVIIYGLPLITRAVPSPLIAIVLLTVLAVVFGIQLPTVGDKGELPDALPTFLLPNIPWTFETLMIILPVSLTLMVVGLLESFLTAQIVDDLTDTPSNKHREAKGQGIANVVSGLFGGMAGCAMIGQSVINVKSGGRGRLSSLAAGVFLLLMIVFLGDYVGMIPMAALVAVMIMVSVGTFSWQSIANLKHHPKTSSLVMIGTVVVTVFTHDLAKGVLTGVLLSALGFARKVSQVLVVGKHLEDEGRTRRYTVTGQVFFASAGEFLAAFDFREVIERVRIDVTGAHLWDLSAVGALDRVILKFRREGVEVELVGMDEASRTLVDRLGVHDKPDAEKLLGH
ncbi:SulP family inorganic anion transporter [Wenzhouxiangella sp. EGI_FJ10409]|uniref:SulP family inorganic anion transporter n=1 Tax=Wenzhouxiangella sp. EGI_FJ10409 TaxID=3243767 RepID=UPI0035DCAED3